MKFPLAAAQAAIYRQPLIWLLAIYAAVLLVNGPALTDAGGVPFVAMASHPGKIVVFGVWQFLYSSPLNYCLAWLLGLNSAFGYFVIHGGEIILMLFCVARAVQKKIAAPEKQILFISLLSLLPIWLITAKWIGKPDTVLIALLFLCWAYATRWRILFSVLMVLAHREVGTIMCLFLYFLEDFKDGNLPIGVILGNALQFVYQYGVLDTPPVSRETLTLLRYGLNLREFMLTPVLYVMSIFSWYWVVVLLNRPLKKELLLLIIAFGMAVISDDFTRDFMLGSLPAVIFHLARAVEKPGNEKLGKLAPLALFHFQIAGGGAVFLPDNLLLSGWSFLRWPG